MHTIIINGEDCDKDSELSFTEEIKVTCNLTIEKIAKAIADKPSNLQGVFFNEFAKQVNIVCKEHTGVSGEFQFMTMARDLNDDSLRMIEAIVYQLSSIQLSLKSDSMLIPTDILLQEKTNEHR